MADSGRRKRNRVRWPILVAGVLVVIAGRAAYLFQREPQLLDRAHRVGAVAEAYQSISLTDHTVLLFRQTDRPRRNGQADPHGENGTESDILIQDVRTQALVTQPRLTTWYNAQWSPDDNETLVSPDGKRILFWTDSSLESHGAVLSIETGFSLLRLSGMEWSKPCWGADSRLYTFPMPRRGDHTNVVHRYTFDGPGTPLLEPLPPGSAPPDPPRELPAEIPTRWAFLDAATSPHGDRTAWVADREASTSVPQWLPFWIRQKIDTAPHRIVSLWISRGDGSNCREIGEADVGHEMEDSLNVPSDLRWTPDGKRVTFIMDSSLYIVNVDEAEYRPRKGCTVQADGAGE